MPESVDPGPLASTRPGPEFVSPRPDLLPEIVGRPWFHTIDLGGGVVTKGTPANPVLEGSRAFPDLRGRSVLDIGAWDGKYSFAAEKAGASRVVALDHYVWRLDWARRQAYWDECEAKGVLPDPSRTDHDFLDPDNVPGRRGFDLARAYLGSSVVDVVDDFMSMDLDALGTFDVVFYFGVLYHMVEPLVALQRLRRVTTGVAVIETEAIVVQEYPESALLGFYGGNELNRDYGNWFAPSEAALHAMCRATGFRRVETRALGEPTDLPAQHRRGRLRRRSASPARCRLVVHAHV